MSPSEQQLPTERRAQTRKMATVACGLLFGFLLASATQGKEETPKSVEDYKNVWVEKYLQIFEEIGSDIEDEDESDATEEVKLLIIQSWIYTMKPDIEILKDMFTGKKPATVEEAKEEIRKKIQNRHHLMPVSDAIMLYVDVVEEKMKNEMIKRTSTITENINALSKQLESESDADKKQQLLKEKESKDTQVEELTFYLRFHKIARRMCLQSYILDFVEGKREEKFVIDSTYFKIKKEFSMPPLKEGDFLSFLNEPEVTRVEAKSL